jgi:protein-disulfide isomerase
MFALMLAAAGCHAQTPVAGDKDKLSPELARRVEILIRSKANVSPEFEMSVGPRTKSEIPGFDKIAVTFTSDGKASKPAVFLLSEDGKTLAQFSKFDISADPKSLVSAADRPARGGPANAPVVIVGFDDLECPYCARMHAQVFPALLQRYKNQVRIVYRDYPLIQIHPWAMRAAIDVNCAADQSTDAYWNLVDSIHAHAGEMGGEEKSVAKANDALDKMTRDEGQKLKLNMTDLNACIAKQNDGVVKASMKMGEDLNLDSTPALFVNGEKLDGAVPIEYLFRMIDGALVAAGQTPPPSVPVPASASAPAATENKPGN